MNNPIYLGVNIDHIATLRQARGTRYPDPIYAAQIAEQAGADGITLHLREDRRHIQDHDVRRLAECIQTRMNLEMAVTDAMINFACEIKPAHCCLVPEKREELTTEGGLDVRSQQAQIQQACERLAVEHIDVSLFIDPDEEQIRAAVDCGAPTIELHTGAYADAPTSAQQRDELKRIIVAAQFAAKQGLVVNAGHGLHFHNTQAIARIEVIHELNIGHALMAQAFFSGLAKAVSDMKTLMIQARA